MTAFYYYCEKYFCNEPLLSQYCIDIASGAKRGAEHERRHYRMTPLGKLIHTPFFLLLNCRCIIMMDNGRIMTARRPMISEAIPDVVPRYEAADAGEPQP
jgi:hypothetical protein